MIRQLGEKRRFRYLNKDRLKSLILQKQLLEYLLNDNFHFEILKRFRIHSLTNQLLKYHLDQQ